MNQDRRANGSGRPRTLRPAEPGNPDWWAAPARPQAGAQPSPPPPVPPPPVPPAPRRRRARSGAGLLIGLVVLLTAAAQVAAFLSLRHPDTRPAEPARLGEERPGPESTGVPDGVALQPSGPVTVRSAGAVIEGLDIDGPVEIAADRVTIRRSRVRGGPHWGIRIAEGVTGALIEEVEIAPSTPSEAVDGIRAEGAFTGRRLDIHGTGDGVKAGSGTRLEASWVHDLASEAETHSDAVQTTGGAGIVLIGNRLEGATNAAVMASTEMAALSGLVIERNWLDGGAHTLNIRAGENGAPSGVRVVGNRFGRGYTYGPAAIDVRFEQVDNVWAADGRAVEL
jgi:hypothetical protein